MKVTSNGNNINSSLACLLFCVDLVKTPLVHTQLQHKINIRFSPFFSLLALLDAEACVQAPARRFPFSD
jgi:hypothetical protein